MPISQAMPGLPGTATAGFLQGYGMSFGLNRNDFDSIMYKFKKKNGVPLKREFTGEQMKLLSITYKNMIRDSGIKIVESPINQLYLAINKVFSSWDSPRARAYRRIMGHLRRLGHGRHGPRPWCSAMSQASRAPGCFSPTAQGFPVTP